MDFNLTEERRMLQDSLRRCLMAEYAPEKRAAIVARDDGHSPAVWSLLAEMGVIGAMFPEDDDGFGGGGFDLSVVFEEFGRVGAIEPLLETAVLAGGLIADLGTAEQKAMLAEIMAGTRQLALAHGEAESRYDLDCVTSTARRQGDCYVLDGEKAVVVNGGIADTLVVSARTAGETRDRDGISLFIVPADADGVRRRSYPLIGGGQGAEISLGGVTVPSSALLGPEGGAFDALERRSAFAITALCAEAVGLMDSIKEMTVEYLRTRKQFGRPIGSFQALQHRMADLLIEIEQARSAAINAAGNLDAPRRERERHASAAKNLIGRAGRLVAEEAIQLHGGIGMTEEYALGHLAKRLVMIDHRFGDTDHHLERFIALSRQ